MDYYNNNKYNMSIVATGILLLYCKLIPIYYCKVM